MTETINKQELIEYITTRIAEINTMEDRICGYDKRVDGEMAGSKSTLEDILEYINREGA